jgi:predicted DNA repair protein MutK
MVVSIIAIIAMGVYGIVALIVRMDKPLKAML